MIHAKGRLTFSSSSIRSDKFLTLKMSSFESLYDIIDIIVFSLKLSRSKGKRGKHHTLSLFYILCAIVKLKKNQFRFSEPDARKFKAYTA